MTAIATLLVVLSVSLLTVRVATVMLVLTGLSLPLAKFQARVAFTGSGYTTRESEQLVSHPVRRRIISTLMLLGNAGVVTTIGTLIAGLVGAGASPLWQRLLLLFAGVVVLWIVASSRTVDRFVNRWTFTLLKKYTTLEVRDYANLMHLGGEYGVSEIRVRRDDALADTPFHVLQLPRQGVIVLGITRADGTYIGAPDADTEAHEGDVLIVYGRTDRLAQLDRRRVEKAHAAAAPI